MSAPDDDDPRSTGELLGDYFRMVDEYYDLTTSPQQTEDALAVLLGLDAVEQELVHRTLPSPRVSK